MDCLANPQPKFFKSRFNDLTSHVTLLLICLLRSSLWTIVQSHFLPNSPSGRCGIAVTRAHRIPAFPVDCSYRSCAVRRDQTGSACAFA
jgi:hypothetical protein